MDNFYKKRKDDDEEFLQIGKRKPRREPKPERRPYVGRFPALPDGRPALGFATLSHSSLKTWGKVSEAYGHNTRQIEAPNVRKDAPKPIELLQQATGSYVDRVKAVLEEHGVKNVRSNAGAIATEDILGASPEYWNRNGDWKLKPIAEIIADPAIQAGVALAHRKHGRRLISISLHLDEESPHIHVVAVPLVEREHARRGPKPKNCELDEQGNPIDPRPRVRKWTLDPSTLRRGAWKLEKNHDEWAAECTRFGLVRGERGSDMSEEERRARRNRQTGRSSVAEKEARERREMLGSEAEADRERARKLIEEAEEKQAAADAAKADAERLKANQAQRELELHELIAAAAADREAAAIERKKAAELKSAGENREAELSALVAQNNGKATEFDRATNRLTDLALLLGRIVDPTCSLKVVPEDGAPSIPGIARDELELFVGYPKAFDEAVGKFLLLTATVFQDREALKMKERELGADRQQLRTLHQQLQSARQQLKSDQERLNAAREEFKRNSETLIGTVDRARKFLDAWTAIPEADRTPQVNAAVNAGTGLTVEDLPAGFTLPGRSGGREFG